MNWSCSTDGDTSNTCRRWGLRRIMWRIIPKWNLGKAMNDLDELASISLSNCQNVLWDPLNYVVPLSLVSLGQGM
jgi:hypothetical protein